MTIGKRIRNFREEKGLSLNKLGDISGVSKAYLSNLENNKSDSPSVEIVQKIAKALEKSISDLITDEKTPETCQSCQFFFEGHNSGGECHRFPPAMQNTNVSYFDGMVDEITTVWGFPEVDITDWCGEYKPKVNA